MKAIVFYVVLTIMVFGGFLVNTDDTYADSGVQSKMDSVFEP